MLFTISFPMIIEMDLSQRILAVTLRDSSVFSFLLKLVLETGAYIPIIVRAGSVVFRKMVKSFDLYLTEQFDDNTFKFIFSTFAITNCIIISYKLIDNMDYHSPDVNFILSRVMMWIVIIVDAWCDSPFSIKKNNPENKEEGAHVGEKIRYWFTIIFTTCLFSIIYASLTFKLFVSWIRTIYILILCGLVACLIAILICKLFVNPSETLSNRKLGRIIKELNSTNKDIGTAHFMRIKYTLMKSNEGGGYLSWEPIMVSYKDNEKQKRNASVLNCLFGGGSKSFVKLDEQPIQEYLISVLRKQDEFLQKGFSECRDEKKRHFEQIERFHN